MFSAWYRRFGRLGRRRTAKETQVSLHRNLRVNTTHTLGTLQLAEDLRVITVKRSNVIGN